MLRSICVAAILTSFLATGAMAVTYPGATASTKPTMALVHKIASKKVAMLHHCKKSMHMVNHKCVAVKSMKY
jgi:serine protease inhibitor